MRRVVLLASLSRQPALWILSTSCRRRVSTTAHTAVITRLPARLVLPRKRGRGPWTHARELGLQNLNWNGCTMDAIDVENLHRQKHTKRQEHRLLPHHSEGAGLMIQLVLRAVTRRSSPPIAPLLWHRCSVSQNARHAARRRRFTTTTTTHVRLLPYHKYVCVLSTVCFVSPHPGGIPLPAEADLTWRMDSPQCTRFAHRINTRLSPLAQFVP